MPTKQTYIRLDEELFKKYEALGKVNERNKTYYMRKALEQYMEAEPQKIQKKATAKKKTVAKLVLPFLDEVKEYCIERGNFVDPQAFMDFYQSKDWMIGKNKMRDWKAAVRNWEKNSKPKAPPGPPPGTWAEGMAKKMTGEVIDHESL